MPNRDATKCIVHGCENKRKWRGVCTACYFAAKREIEAGHTTDEKLVKQRYWLKSNRTGRPSTSRLGAILKARRAKAPA